MRGLVNCSVHYLLTQRKVCLSSFLHEVKPNCYLLTKSVLREILRLVGDFFFFFWFFFCCFATWIKQNRDCLNLRNISDKSLTHFDRWLRATGRCKARIYVHLETLDQIRTVKRQKLSRFNEIIFP